MVTVVELVIQTEFFQVFPSVPLGKSHNVTYRSFSSFSSDHSKQPDVTVYIWSENCCKGRFFFQVFCLSLATSRKSEASNIISSVISCQSDYCMNAVQQRMTSPYKRNNLYVFLMEQHTLLEYLTRKPHIFSCKEDIRRKDIKGIRKVKAQGVTTIINY